MSGLVPRYENQGASSSIDSGTTVSSPKKTGFITSYILSLYGESVGESVSRTSHGLQNLFNSAAVAIQWGTILFGSAALIASLTPLIMTLLRLYFKDEFKSFSSSDTSPSPKSVPQHDSSSLPEENSNTKEEDGPDDESRSA